MAWTFSKFQAHFAVPKFTLFSNFSACTLRKYRASVQLSFYNLFLHCFFFQLRSSFSKAFGRNKSSGNLSEENGISASKLNSTTNGVHSELKLQRKVYFAHEKKLFFAFSKNEKKPLWHTKKIKIEIERYNFWKLYNFFPSFRS